MRHDRKPWNVATTILCLVVGAPSVLVPQPASAGLPEIKGSDAESAYGQGILWSHASREDLRRPRPPAPHFVPRAATRQGAQAAAAARKAVRQVGPGEAWQEDTSILLELWQNRPSPAELQRQIHASLARPAEPAARSQADQWHQIGAGIFNPLNDNHMAGRVRSAAYEYDDTQGLTVLWLGTTGGGLWKVRVAGFFGFWVPVSDTLPGSPSVGAFVVDPESSNRILIATGDFTRYAGTGVYRTIDGGRNWNNVPIPDTPSTFQRMWVDRSNSEVVLLSGDTGIWRTTDFGEEWTQVYDGPTTDLAQDPNPTFHEYWYAGAPNIGILESNDNGQSFHPITAAGGNGIRPPKDRISLSVCESNSRYVYAIVTNGNSLNGIYRSNDYGNNWVDINDTDNIGWSVAFQTNAIAVDPDDCDRVIAGQGNLKMTQNATAASPTWLLGGADGEALERGHADQTSFLFVPNAIQAGSTRIIITNDGGYYSLDYTTGRADGVGNLLGLNVQQTWPTAANNTLAVSYSDPGIMLAGLFDNGVVRIDQESPNEIQHVRCCDGGQVSIRPNQPEEWFFSAGASFSRFYTEDGAGTIYGIDCGLAPAGTPAVLVDQSPWALPDIYTFDTSAIWTKPISPQCGWTQVNAGTLPLRPKQLDQAKSLYDYVFYVTGANDRRLLVMDSSEHGSPGGMTWDIRTPPLPSPYSPQDARVHADRSFYQPDTVYYATGFGRPSRAFLSHDRGKNWLNVTGDLATNLPDANYQELLANPRDLDELYLATSVGLYRSDNRGATWYRYMNGLPAVVNVTAMELSSDGLDTPKLRIASYGRGFWERELGSADAIFADGFESGDLSAWN